MMSSLDGPGGQARRAASGDGPEPALTSPRPASNHARRTNNHRAIIAMSAQLFEETKRTEAGWRELEWTATHYEQATPEQRARLDAFLEATE